MIEYDKYQKSLKHLDLQFQNYSTLDPSLPLLIQEGVAESVIQRFETCWDCLWKVLKRYLRDEIALPEVPNGPNPILRLAHENKLLASGIEVWLRYARARVGTSHDYSGEKADECLLLMADFIDDAQKLYEMMSENKWEKNIR